MSSWPMYLVDLKICLMLIRFLVPIIILEKLKPTSLILLATLSLISLIISYPNVVSIYVLTLYNSTQTL